MKMYPNRNNLCSKYATKMLSIKITSKCNRSCEFCVDRGGRKESHINIHSIAEKAISYNEYKTVVITGGEPFIVFDKTLELIKRIRKHKEYIVLNTNGTLLSDKNVTQLNGLIDELQVSIHHYDEIKNAMIFGGYISFESMKKSLTIREFRLSVNKCLTNEYSKQERKFVIDKMVELCKYLHADKLRITELKKVGDEQFVPASDFLPDQKFTRYNSNKLIKDGCTHYFSKDSIKVSLKRLCEYAKGENATAFSCCFIDSKGQKKIDVDTEETFKVIYGDGLVTNDWIFKE